MAYLATAGVIPNICFPVKTISETSFGTMDGYWNIGPYTIDEVAALYARVRRMRLIARDSPPSEIQMGATFDNRFDPDNPYVEAVPLSLNASTVDLSSRRVVPPAMNLVDVDGVLVTNDVDIANESHLACSPPLSYFLAKNQVGFVGGGIALFIQANTDFFVGSGGGSGFWGPGPEFDMASSVDAINFVRREGTDDFYLPNDSFQFEGKWGSGDGGSAGILCFINPLSFAVPGYVSSAVGDGGMDELQIVGTINFPFGKTFDLYGLLYSSRLGGEGPDHGQVLSMSLSGNVELTIAPSEIEELPGYWPHDPSDGNGPIYDSLTGDQLRPRVIRTGDGKWVELA